MSKRLVVEILTVFACIFLLSVPTAFAPCYPPPNNSWCEGNFNYDCDVDGSDASKFKSDFGRNNGYLPCPPNGPAMVPKTGMVSSWFGGDDGSTQCGMASPNPRFTDNGDGTVTDNLTGLIWLKDAGCLTVNQTCVGAVGACWELNNGECGLTDGSVNGDWRLPTIREMYSLIDYGQHDPALTPGMFANQNIWVFCTSTVVVDDPTNYGWCVNTQHGHVESYIGANWFGALCVKTTHPYCPETVTTVPTTTVTTTSSSTTTSVYDCEVGINCNGYEPMCCTVANPGETSRCLCMHGQPGTPYDGCWYCLNSYGSYASCDWHCNTP